MLAVTLPQTLAKILLYGGLALAAAGLVWLDIRYEARRRDAAVPPATVVGASRWWRPWLRWLPPIAVACAGLATAFVIYTRWLDVVIVRDTAGVMHAERYVRLGGLGTVVYAFGARHRDDDDMHDPTCVLNESARPILIETVQYGRGIGLTNNKPLTVLPNTAACERRVEYLGPDDAPPQTITQQSGKLDMAFRTWVMWD